MGIDKVMTCDKCQLKVYDMFNCKKITVETLSQLGGVKDWDGFTRYWCKPCYAKMEREIKN